MGKKIGIMTFWQSKTNYGQILQGYALQQILKKIGYEPYLIRYNQATDTTFQPTMWERLYYAITNPTIIINKIKRTLGFQTIPINVLNENRQFDDFINEYFEISKQIYNTYSSLKATPPKADVYICGSDVVWYPIPNNEPYFLTFAKETKRIAYAPSFGNPNIPKRRIKKIKHWLNSFDAISTREQTGADLVNKLLNRNDCIQNPDPTLLLEKDDYQKLFSVYKGKNYAVSYFLGTKSNIDENMISQNIKKNGLEYKYIAAQENPNKGNFDATIQEWLQAIYYADIVFTNSFHGVVFSLIFNKKVIYFPIVGKVSGLNNRIKSLLNILDIPEEQIIFANSSDILNTELNYEHINLKLETERKRAIKWLKLHLNTNS